MFTIKNEDVVSADLLSIEEVKNIPQWIRANGDWWWLKYAQWLQYTQLSSFWLWYAPGINGDGFIYFRGNRVNYDSVAVRPTITILNLPSLEIGETVKVFNRMAQYIGNDKVLLCESIFKSRFDKSNSNYETSEVKQKLDKWFNQMKSGVK